MKRLASAAAIAAAGAVALLRPYSPQGCTIVGDSIAVGVANVETGCAARARVGASAGAIASWSLPAGHFRWAVISAGSNNPTDPRLREQLRRIRANLHADRVAWLRPVHPRAAAIVDQVAAERGDVEIRFIPGRDGIHPRAYPPVAAAVRARFS